MRTLRLGACLTVIFAASHARAQTIGCTEGGALGPTLTPAMQSASDLRCFSAEIPVHPRAVVRAPTSIFPVVLASVGGAGIATFIGFGMAGASQISGGAVSTATLDSARVDYAIANIALAVGITALVTGIVLVLVSPHH